MAGAIKRSGETGGAKHPLDKFYTKEEHAKACIARVKPLLDASSVVIEPSAGSGAFSNNIAHPSLYALDLEPESANVRQGDWFHTRRSDFPEGNLLVIGNPPFGVRADLAKKFISHSTSLRAETIAFILPRVFSKVLNQSTALIPAEYRLVQEEVLPPNAFRLDGATHHIPCAWYVWTTNQQFMAGTDLRKQTISQHPDFQFAPRGTATAHFTINGNSGRVKDLTQVSNPKSEHYISVSNPTLVATVRSRFEQIKLDLVSSVSGGVAWAGQQEILQGYAAVAGGSR